MQTKALRILFQASLLLFILAIISKIIGVISSAEFTTTILLFLVLTATGEWLAGHPEQEDKKGSKSTKKSGKGSSSGFVP